MPIEIDIDLATCAIGGKLEEHASPVWLATLRMNKFDQLDNGDTIAMEPDRCAYKFAGQGQIFGGIAAQNAIEKRG